MRSPHRLEPKCFTCKHGKEAKHNEHYYWCYHDSPVLVRLKDCYICDLYEGFACDLDEKGRTRIPKREPVKQVYKEDSNTGWAVPWRSDAKLQILFNNEFDTFTRFAKSYAYRLRDVDAIKMHWKMKMKKQKRKGMKKK